MLFPNDQQNKPDPQEDRYETKRDTWNHAATPTLDFQGKLSEHTQQAIDRLNHQADQVLGKVIGYDDTYLRTFRHYEAVGSVVERISYHKTEYPIDPRDRYHSSKAVYAEVECDAFGWGEEADVYLRCEFSSQAEAEAWCEIVTQQIGGAGRGYRMQFLGESQ